MVELVVYIDPPDEAGSTLPGSETCCYPSHLPPGAAFSSLTSSTLYMDVSPKASPWWLLKSWWDDLVGHVAGEGVEVLPVGVSVLRSQLVVAQISCLPRLPYNNLTCTEARGRRLSGTRPGPGAAPQLPSTITLLTGSFCSIYHWCPMSMTMSMTTIVVVANLTKILSNAYLWGRQSILLH